MCVALIGGMDRLKKHYIKEAKKVGVDLKILSQCPGAKEASKVRKVDAMVIFTNKISHNAKKAAVNIAKQEKMPLSMYHSCGVSTLRNYLTQISQKLSN